MGLLRNKGVKEVSADPNIWQASSTVSYNPTTVDPALLHQAQQAFGSHQTRYDEPFKTVAATLFSVTKYDPVSEYTTVIGTFSTKKYAEDYIDAQDDEYEWDIIPQVLDSEVVKFDTVEQLHEASGHSTLNDLNEAFKQGMASYAKG